LKFFKEYTPLNEVNPIKDYKMIAYNYVTTYFVWDIIAIIPL